MTFWEKVKLVLSDIWEFLEPFVLIFLTESGQIVAEVAFKVVVEIALTMGDADGETKRKAAYQIIVDELSDRGLTLGVSVINAAIEAAVQRLKGND